MKQFVRLPIINRRLFAHRLGELSLASFFLARSQKLQAQNCEQEDIKQNQSAVGLQNEMLAFWLDGLSAMGRAHLSIFIKFAQTPKRYVERVVFTTNEKRTLAARYFTYQQHSANRYPPYLIFNHVDLRFSRRYFLVVQAREEGHAKVYRYTFDQSLLTPSRLIGSALPREVQADFLKSHQGQVHTPWRFPVKLLRPSYCEGLNLEAGPCFQKHFPQAAIKNIGAGNVFTIDVDLGYPDIDDSRYMRYILLTDPVGRLLSLAKRSFGDPYQISLTGLGDAFWQKRWGLAKEHIASINHCPYLMLFAEHVTDGLYQIPIWLH